MCPNEKVSDTPSEDVLRKLASFQNIIPQFDGLSSITPKYFVENLEYIAELAKCSPEEKLLIMRSRIRGDALTNLINSPDLNHEKDFTQFKKKFLAYFDTEYSLGTKQRQFSNCKMLPHEQVKLYAAKVSHATQNFFDDPDLSNAAVNSQWDNYIDFYCLIYNTSIHNATKETPCHLQLGFDPILPTDILQEQRPPRQFSYADFVSRKAAHLKYVQKKVAENLLQAKINQERYENRNAKYRDFAVGDTVYLNNKSCDRNRLTTKRRLNEGPFQITKRHNAVDYSIKDPHNPGSRTMKIHAERLLPFIVRKAGLDLFQTTVAHSPSRHHSYELEKNKIHAQFDENPDIHLLWDTSSQKKNHSPKNDSQTLPPSSSIVESPAGSTTDTVHTQSLPSTSEDSSDTIIYTPPTSTIDSTPQNPERVRTHNYSLRSLSTRLTGENILDWAFKMTE